MDDSIVSAPLAYFTSVEFKPRGLILSLERLKKMIIWKGAGFIVAVVAFLMLLVTELSVEAFFGDDKYYQTHGWPKLVAFFIAGCIVFFIGKYLNRKKGRVLIDKETGKEVALKSAHSLFFIDVEYWSYILFALGVVFLFVKSD